MSARLIERTPYRAHAKHILLKVMYDGVHRKKEIYDKRPEDHPQYPEEWRIFWEKRYKEIQNQGKDADNYDYKPDWIPYWAKKSHELYKKEIHVKTQDLLKKFDLKSADEPLREDFEHLNRPIEPMRGRGTRLDRTQKFGIFTLFSVLFFRR